MRLPVALTIAGSDSGGGAGIQADLRTFAALGVHGTSAVTAITAQNTLGVTAILELPVAIIRAQVDAVVEDLHPAAAKTGMIASAEIIEAVATAIEAHRLTRLVVDPVMVAKGGARLLRPQALEALRSRLLPLARVVTPNLPEAEVLLGRSIETADQVRRAAEDLRALGPRAVILKGGHGQGPVAADAVLDGDRFFWMEAPRAPTANTHGSGCTFSAAIAAGLARGLELEPAARAAKAFITEAILHSLEIGGGHGPVNSMWRLAGAHAEAEPPGDPEPGAGGPGGRLGG